jgi:molybdopterin/thiamine biosynthesis adenylyltransferase
VRDVIERLENVPLGRFRADAILAGLDSRIARRHAHEMAWRLGVPLIDAGVEPTDWLARVTVYVPGPGHPCLECAWDERSYQLQEQEYPCQPNRLAVAPTNGHASLGALAAALLAVECQKLLEGRLPPAAVGRQLLQDATSHRLVTTAHRRFDQCRFDHEVWGIRNLAASPARFTLAAALALGGRRASLRMDNHPLIARLSCPACGRQRPVLRLKGRIPAGLRRCANCGCELLATGADMIDPIDADALTARELARPLAGLGFRAGDVFTVRRGNRDRHYQLAEDPKHG